MDKRKKTTEINNAARQITEYLNQIASIRSVFDTSALKVLDSYKNQIASIESVFDSSAFKAMDEYKNRITSISTSLAILSKSDTFSSSVRNVIEANKSILAMTNSDMSRFLPKNQQQTQEIIKSLRTTFDTPGMLSASLAAQTKLAELKRLPLGSAINAAASLQESLRQNLDKFTSNYRNLFEFTDREPSIIEILDPDIIQYSSYEVFREAELLEQITVPEDEQVDLDEYEIIAIPEERTLEDWLGKFNLDFPTLLQGARAALNTDNPDRARHVASSLRELIGHILRQLAPEDKIRGWNTDPSYYHNSRPTRKARLLYLCREFDFAPLSKFVGADVKSAIYLIEALNAETHVISRRLTDRQLQALVDRTESCLLFLLRLNSANE